MDELEFEVKKDLVDLITELNLSLLLFGEKEGREKCIEFLEKEMETLEALEQRRNKQHV